ncbi:uncharacterized protein CTHT_0056710 [Thermochaetoides thermophila DSM 1495]|uniref:Nudix hydrolase domain-containing protein n=1 Tax=Chaetomium thermophilum (strain DSM 1495 / CBS 144.50 / IMI 039719) TaxID=759272 RepID=G0SCC3_CHATD|nr:hypothetical protein CTHT_0056710 [Thermochaetoides thermophila DSM 1495]EGS19049.1 hypothetical protein CTHT_0056710 [Thermochaetoides thermophila DSM 1495]
MSAGFAGAGEDSVPSESPAVITAERQTEITKAVKEESKSGLEPEEDLTILTKGSHYWELSSMAPLNAVSAAAIARLRAYRPPPFPLWDRLPLSRRAAVLMLLYADKRGDLRVVITMRAASLRSFSGHAALPGGKADSLDETPYQIARREAWEEIGLPMDDSKIPPPFRIEHLCYLPMNLARNELVVRPCVAFLHTAPDPTTPSATPSPSSFPSLNQGPRSPTTQSPAALSPSSSASSSNPTKLSKKNTADLTVEDSLIPRLDAKEVAAVFSAPFHNFLRATDEPPASPEDGPLPPGKWYEGQWATWHDQAWRMHFFYVPVSNQKVVRPSVKGRKSTTTTPTAPTPEANGNGDGEREEKKSQEQDDELDAPRYKVWGMTARILVDAATIAYGEQPEFEHNRHFGDEKIIVQLAEQGRLGPKKRERDAAAKEKEKDGESKKQKGIDGSDGGESSKM